MENGDKGKALKNILSLSHKIHGDRMRMMSQSYTC